MYNMSRAETFGKKMGYTRSHKRVTVYSNETEEKYKKVVIMTHLEVLESLVHSHGLTALLKKN